MTTVVFVRHAQSAPSPDLPEEEWPLSDKGRRQAEALVPVLRELGVSALASSPFVRAIDTLQPFAEATGLPLAIDEGLRERRLTDAWLPDVAAVEAAVRRMFADLSFAHPGGESGHACLARFEAAVGRVVEAHPGAVIAIGTHGGVLGHLMHGRHTEPAVEFWRAIKNPHLFIFDYAGEPRWIGERTLDSEL